MTKPKLVKRITAIEQYNLYFANVLRQLKELTENSAEDMKEFARLTLRWATVVPAYLDPEDWVGRKPWLVSAPSQDIYNNCKLLKIMTHDLLCILEIKHGREIDLSDLV